MSVAVLSETVPALTADHQCKCILATVKRSHSYMPNHTCYSDSVSQNCAW